MEMKKENRINIEIT